MNFHSGWSYSTLIFLVGSELVRCLKPCCFSELDLVKGPDLSRALTFYLPFCWSAFIIPQQSRAPTHRHSSSEFTQKKKQNKNGEHLQITWNNERRSMFSCFLCGGDTFYWKGLYYRSAYSNTFQSGSEVLPYVDIKIHHTELTSAKTETLLELQWSDPSWYIYIYYTFFFPFCSPCHSDAS